MLAYDFLPIGLVRSRCLRLRSLYEGLVVFATECLFRLIRPAITVVVTVLALVSADTLARFARRHQDNATVN